MITAPTIQLVFKRQRSFSKKARDHACIAPQLIPAYSSFSLQSVLPPEAPGY